MESEMEKRSYVEGELTFACGMFIWHRHLALSSWATSTHARMNSRM